MTLVAAVDGPARVSAIRAAAAGCVQPQRDNEVILVSFVEPRDVALGDGGENIHTTHDG